MAAKEEKDHEDQHVGHVAFRIPDFWPHDPTMWFQKIESKFRICNIRQSSTKYDHLLSALPTHLQQHQRQPGGDRRERRGRLRAAEGIAYVSVHHGPLCQRVRAA